MRSLFPPFFQNIVIISKNDVKKSFFGFYSKKYGNWYFETGGNDAVVLLQGKYYAEDTFPTNSKSWDTKYEISIKNTWTYQSYNLFLQWWIESRFEPGYLSTWPKIPSFPFAHLLQSRHELEQWLQNRTRPHCSWPPPASKEFFRAMFCLLAVLIHLSFKLERRALFVALQLRVTGYQKSCPWEKSIKSQIALFN